MTSLDLALIGNSSVAALIDASGTIVWSCLPRFDSDAVFCALLREGRGADDYGFFEIELADFDQLLDLSHADLTATGDHRIEVP